MGTIEAVKLIKICLIFILLFKKSYENLAKKLDLSDLYSVCQQCPFGTYDFNQCLHPTETNCMDATEPVKRLARKPDVNTKSVISIKTSDNVFGEDILRTTKLKSNIHFHEFNRQSSNIFLRDSKLIVNITLLNINLLPTFEDIDHKSDNDFILNSSLDSNLYHLKKPLLQIIKNYCRHPIPDSYFITMTTFNNRHTKAKKYNCDHDTQLTSNYCLTKPLEQSSFYIRSVNNQCSKNKAVHLSKEPNSFYCVNNNRLANDIFHHQLRESMSEHPDDTCDFARRKCNTCLNLQKNICLKNQKLNKSGSIEENCCAPKCLSNKHCQTMYSSECHLTDRLRRGLDQEICMQGDTVKFTLNPQFHFDNNKFRCHIRKKSSDYVLKLIIQFHIQNAHGIGSHWSSNFVVKEIPFSDPGSITSGNISIFWSSKLVTDSEMILHGYQNSNYADPLFSILKINENPILQYPKVHQHGDKSYVEVEFEKIFEYSISNWYDSSCQINISKIRPVNKNFNFTNVQNVIPFSIVRGKGNSPFIYILKSALEDPEIEILIKENSSLLRSLLCFEVQADKGKIVNDLQNQSITVQLSLHKWPNQWNLLVEGFVSNDATFVNVQVTDIVSGVLLTNFEQIVFNRFRSSGSESLNQNRLKIPIEFAIYFHLDLHHLSTNDSKITQIALLIQVQDCFTTYRKYIYHSHHPYQSGSENKSPLLSKYLSIDKKSELHNNNNINNPIHSEMYYFLLQYLAIITFTFSIIYCFIIVALIIIKLCLKNDPKIVMEKININFKACLNQSGIQTVRTISRKKRMILFFFVAFKVFYTFIFTLSVGLSLVLSLESNYAPFEITPSRLLNSVEQDVRKLDTFCTDELRRQSEFKNSMYKACQEKRTKYKISMENEIKNKFDIIIDPWLINKKQLIYRSISNVFYDHYQKEVEMFYNYSKQIITKQINGQISRYSSFITQFSNLLYLKNGLMFYKNVSKILNETLIYGSLLTKEIKLINIYEPLGMLSSCLFIEKMYSRLENIVPKADPLLKTNFFNFQKIVKSKMKRYFQSTYKVQDCHMKTSQSTIPVSSKINKIYKRQLRTIAKDYRFQLRISLWQMRLVIVFIDIIIIVYRFYHTFTTIKIIWFGAHIYLTVNDTRKFKKHKIESYNAYPTFQYWNFNQYKGNRQSLEITELELSTNKFLSYLFCCKRLYFICITISLTLLIGTLSVFLMSFYFISLYNINMPSEVTQKTLQYLNQKVNWIITKHGNKINSENLRSSIHNDFNNKKHSLWLQQIFQNDGAQIQKNIYHQICTLPFANNFFHSLKTLCNENHFENSIYYSFQPCHFINIKSLNYTENQIVKEMYPENSMVTSRILIPLFRFLAVSLLVVSAILVMLGIIYHSSKLLSRILLTISQPINATLLNKDFPILSKAFEKQPHSHSNKQSIQIKSNFTFNTPKKSFRMSPVFLKDLSPLIARYKKSMKASESRV